MPQGVTTIGNGKADLRLYVYAGDAVINICQGYWWLIDDVIPLDSEETARGLVKAIRNRIADEIWADPCDDEMIKSKNPKMSLYVSTRQAAGEYPSGVLIEQYMSVVCDSAILVDTKDRAGKLINAIIKRGKELGWEV